MTGQDHRRPDAPDEQPPRGFNGLPELEDLGIEAPIDIASHRPLRGSSGRPLRRFSDARETALAAWAAITVIVVPAVIAYWTMRRLRRRADRFDHRAADLRHDDTAFTPPHGDKLLYRQHSER
jgi:hypothetical protein